MLEMSGNRGRWGVSRSMRKTPITGITTCRSEKEDKRMWHRRWRARQRTTLHSAGLEDVEYSLASSVRQYSNVWDMGKDGRQYWGRVFQLLMAKRMQRGHGQRRTKQHNGYALHKLLGK